MAKEIWNCERGTRRRTVLILPEGRRYAFPNTPAKARKSGLHQPVVPDDSCSPGATASLLGRVSDQQIVSYGGC